MEVTGQVTATGQLWKRPKSKCEQGTLRPLQPSLTSQMRYGYEVQKSEIIVNIWDYILTPRTSDRWDCRKSRLWSGARGLLWDELEASHSFLLCRPVTFPGHCEPICFNLLQVTPDRPKDLTQMRKILEEKIVHFAVETSKMLGIKEELGDINLKKWEIF